MQKSEIEAQHDLEDLNSFFNGLRLKIFFKSLHAFWF